MSQRVRKGLREAGRGGDEYCRREMPWYQNVLCVTGEMSAPEVLIVGVDRCVDIYAEFECKLVVGLYLCRRTVRVLGHGKA